MATKPKSAPIDIDELLSAIPDLVSTEVMDIDGTSVLHPRIKVSHPNHPFVQDGEAPAFSLFVELGREDTDRQVLFTPQKGSEETGPDFTKAPDAGFLVYVLAMTRGFSGNVIDGRIVSRDTPGAVFRSWQYDDPSVPEGADLTYNYVVMAPDSPYPDRPHKMLLTRSNTPTAVAMNTFIEAAGRQGRPAYVVPFRLWTERRQRTVDGQTQRWGVVKARVVLPTLEHVQLASGMTGDVNAARRRSLPAPAPAPQELATAEAPGI